MHKVEKTVFVNHSAAKMFTLVDTVEDYPKFLPWCGGVDLLERSNTNTCATLHINYHGLKQKFSTQNSKVFPLNMEMQLKDGPFKHFEGSWCFIELQPDACKIMFRLNYEFANSMLEKLISPVFNHIAATFVDGFVTQADKIFKG
jgi:ribosome-associated toxin RatA of RatAB toxin-antitoxin module